MLELPESKVYAKQMNETIVGKRIVSVMMDQSPHKFAFYSMNASEYPRILEGMKIKGCQSFGGMIEVDFDEYKLIFADGAYPRYHKTSQSLPKKHQMMIELDDGSYITVGIQMYGVISLSELKESPSEYYDLAVVKPSPLTDGFTYSYFHRIYEKSPKKISAKALLATEQRIPGLGNGVLQDILFLAGIHPKRSIQTLTEEELEKLYQTTLSVLESMIEEEGRDTEKDFFGAEGKYMTYMSKKTYLSPCPNCGSEIRKAAYMGGTVYYCEKCQPL